MNFGGLLGAIEGIGGGLIQPKSQNQGCRLCTERANKRAGANAHGALGLFGQALSNVTQNAAAEVTTLIHKPADIDRYSKDHLDPDPIDREMVIIPPVIQDVQKGIYQFATDVKPFDYKDCPIEADQDIRLLRLLSPEDAAKLKPGIPEDIICCNLVKALPGESHYDALSYTWGTLPRKVPILVLGESNTGGITSIDLFALLATPQLFAALRALRKRGTHCLWIDQLCINQGDQTTGGEKSQQIGRMDEIYLNAKQTVIWVGEQDEHALNFKKVLDRFRAEFPSKAPESNVVAWVKRDMNIQGEDSLPEKDASREAVRRFLNREWFSRAWIFQEAVLSKVIKFQCGTIEFPFDDVIRLATAVYKYENSIAGYARSLMKTTVGYNTLDLIKHAKGECDCSIKDCPLKAKLKPDHLLEMLLVVLQHLRATQPGDLINAFIGVAFKDSPKNSGKRLQAITGKDYEKAWIAAAEHIIRSTKSLDILAAASGDSDDTPKIPSWVPDWSRCFKFASPFTPPDFFTSFTASEDRIWQDGKDKIKGNELTVQGKVVDTIAWFTPHGVEKYYFMLPGPRRTERILKLYEHVAAIRAKLGGVPSAAERQGEKLEHAVLRTLLADGAFGHDLRIREPMHDLVDVYDLEDEIEEKDGPESRDRILLNKLREWGLVAQKKGVFLTQNNVLGLAPHTSSGGARIGDCIAILHGSKVPCVIRAVDGASNRYRVIGQCYLDKWMREEDMKCTWEVDKADEMILV